MFKKVLLRKIEEETPLTCFRVDYWKGIDQRYAMIAASDIFDAEQRFRKVYPSIAESDVIDICEMEEK